MKKIKSVCGKRNIEKKEESKEEIKQKTKVKSVAKKRGRPKKESC